MAMFFNDTVTWEGSFEQQTVYTPAKHPGFVAWASAFTYGDGSIGLSFDERIQENNPSFTPSKLEYAEAAGVPVSYCSVETGSKDQHSFRVYMRSTDGKNFVETGRCSRDKDGALCNVGFPDGRIICYDVPRHNEEGTAWSHFIRVQESTDGGNTWKDICKLFEGCALYMWRARRLRNGDIILLASFYGTAWGPDQLRATRNTMLPYETYEIKNQTFFVTSSDGYHYSPPNYILPGIGAHEYDFVELDNGRLLFIAGDVQGTPVGRQFVVRTKDGWVNEGGTFPIHTGAPIDTVFDAQGGYIPETMVWDQKNKCILGYRRNKCFSLSNDLGANWVRIDMTDPFTHLYQPFMIELPDGKIGIYGHVGGDNAFGENDMTVVGQILDVDCAKYLPMPTTLSLNRILSEDGSHYLNAFRARLLTGNQPIEGATIEFRFNDSWREDGCVNKTPQAAAPLKLRAVTDAEGVAQVHVSHYDNRSDIHLAYRVDATCIATEQMRRSVSPEMVVMALTPYRRCLFPRDAYFAGGTLFLAPQFLQDFPGIMNVLSSCVGDSDVLPAGKLCAEAEQRLLKSGVLFESEDGTLHWIKSIHAPRPLDDVKPMLTGDWYE